MQHQRTEAKARPSEGDGPWQGTIATQETTVLSFVYSRAPEGSLLEEACGRRLAKAASSSSLMRGNLRGPSAPRGAGSRRGVRGVLSGGALRERRRRVGVAEIPTGSSFAAETEQCHHESSLPTSAGMPSNTLGTVFELHGIRKALPANPSQRGRARKPTKVSVKKRSALRGALAAAELDAEEDLCDALERTALRSQRVAMGHLATTACATPAPEHLPLAPSQRLHFTLESVRIGRGSMVVASIGECTSSADRPVVVTTRPDPAAHTCEVVVQNTGDDSIEGPFTVRFSVFAMGDMASLSWTDDLHPNRLLGRRNSLCRHSHGASAPGVGAVAVVPAELTQADRVAMGVGESGENAAPAPLSGTMSQLHGMPLWRASWQQIDAVL